MLMVLRERMIDGHVVGHGHVDIVATQRVHQLQRLCRRNVQFSLEAADIADRPGFQPSTKARHQFQEKAIEMIGAERDDDFRIELTNRFFPFSKRLLKHIPVFRLLVVAVQ